MSGSFAHSDTPTLPPVYPRQGNPEGYNEEAARVHRNVVLLGLLSMLFLAAVIGLTILLYSAPATGLFEQLVELNHELTTEVVEFVKGYLPAR